MDILQLCLTATMMESEYFQASAKEIVMKLIYRQWKYMGLLVILMRKYNPKDLSRT